MARILEFNKNLGFPGMLCSIDFMHWSSKNCPTLGMGSTIILEAVADYETSIRHAFFLGFMFLQ
jgi:hypothetical protein